MLRAEYTTQFKLVWIAAPVPEPATAALALAGLAMLIRRRK